MTTYKKGITLANKDDEASYRAESDISTKYKKRPTQKEMLEDYKESSVHCVKCNYDIGNCTSDKCPNCKFSTNESLAQWIIKNAKFEVQETG